MKQTHASYSPILFCTAIEIKFHKNAISNKCRQIMLFLPKFMNNQSDVIEAQTQQCTSEVDPVQKKERKKKTQKKQRVPNVFT